MIIRQLVSLSLRGAASCAAVALALCASSSYAGTLQIQFTGMDLVYDGTALYDAGANAGGNLDPGEADPLQTVDFIVDGNNVLSLSDDVSLDVFIPDVNSIPDTGIFTNITTPGNPGFFDLLICTSPLAAEFLSIDLDEVQISYLDAGLFEFTFGAAISDDLAQNLPLGLQIGDPVTVSFSAAVVHSSLTTAGGFVTGFLANGTGQISGEVIPEPTSAMLMAVAGLVALPLARRRA